MTKAEFVTKYAIVLASIWGRSVILKGWPFNRMASDNILVDYAPDGTGVFWVAMEGAEDYIYQGTDHFEAAYVLANWLEKNLLPLWNDEHGDKLHFTS